MHHALRECCVLNYKNMRNDASNLLIMRNNNEKYKYFSLLVQSYV